VEVLHVLFQLAVGIAVPALVIRRDLARLAPERLARSWNDASLWSAIVAFGPVAVVVHFTRTRRSLVGLLLGLGWAGVPLAASALVSLFFSALER